MHVKATCERVMISYERVQITNFCFLFFFGQIYFVRSNIIYNSGNKKKL